jgi:tetratricopeptide (TPR) repeat protein
VIFRKKPNPTKLLNKADKYFSQNKFKKALSYYQQANELDPDNKEIYDKMIKSHLEIKDTWTDTDFSNSLTWTMKMQELNNPSLKIVHAKMSPEWIEDSRLIRHLLLTQDASEETRIIQDILALGEKAVYPLLDLILTLKNSQKPDEPNQ